MTDQQSYQPDADYDLQVSRSVTVGAFKYLPRHTSQVKGSLINRIIEENGKDAIRSAVAR